MGDTGDSYSVSPIEQYYSLREYSAGAGGPVLME
jgi:hypothetical protein